MTGYVRDAARRLVQPWGVSAAAADSSADLTHLAPAIFDQGATSSCVGHARARGIYVARAAAGKPLATVPSPAFLYKLARCYTRSDWGSPLQDFGADPISTLDAVRGLGCAPMGTLAPDRYSDCLPETINDVPDLLDVELATLYTSDWQIVSTGAARVEAVKQALSAGLPVCLDVHAGPGSHFADYSDGILSADYGPLDHYVVLVGYAGDVFIGHNSWGIGWGEIGTFRCDSSVIAASADMIVCEER